MKAFSQSCSAHVPDNERRPNWLSWTQSYFWELSAPNWYATLFDSSFNILFIFFFFGCNLISWRLSVTETKVSATVLNLLNFSSEPLEGILSNCISFNSSLNVLSTVFWVRADSSKRLAANNFRNVEHETQQRWRLPHFRRFVTQHSAQSS